MNLQGDFILHAAASLCTTPERVSIENIDWQDQSLSITAGRDTKLLEASIARCGLVQPLILAPKRDGRGYRIVCGMLRVKALIACGIPECEARVVASSVSEEQLALAALYDNVPHRDFNAIEKARGAALLARVFPPAVALQLGTELLSLPATRDALRRYLELAQAEELIQNLVLQGAVSVEIACALMRMEAHDREHFISLFSRLHFSSSKQAEILDFCADISRRDNVAISWVLSTPPIAELLSNVQKQNAAQIAEQVRQHIRALRFPNLTASEQRFRELRNELRLPSTIMLEPPPFFEGTEVRLSFRVRSTDELRTLAHHVAALAEHPRMKAWFEE